MIAAANPAVQAVIFANITDFDKTANKDGLAIGLLRCLSCKLCGKCSSLAVIGLDELLISALRERVRRCQCFNEGFGFRRHSSPRSTERFSH